MFFKKKENFPMDEKEEVLKDVPPAPAPTQFRSPSELLPPKLPDLPKQPINDFGDIRVPQQPPVAPKPEPKPIEHPIKNRVIEKPHVFIKVEQYKDVMKKLGELADNIQVVSNELNSLSAMETQEKEKIEEANKTIERMNEIIRFLDDTFNKAEM